MTEFKIGSYEAWAEEERKYYRAMRDRLGLAGYREAVARSERKSAEDDMGHSYNAGLKLMREVRDE